MKIFSFVFYREVSIVSIFDFESNGVFINTSLMFFYSGAYLSFFMLVFLCFICGWFRTYYFRKQFLLSLLSLELVSLRLFLLVVFLLGMYGKSISVAFYLLVLAACEASLGLRLLVNIVRLSGRDMLSLFRVVKC